MKQELGVFRQDTGGFCGSSPMVRSLLILTAIGFICLFLVLPLFVVFSEALARGFLVFWEAINNQDTRSAIFLTLVTALIVVPANLIFGLAAAWLISRFRFPGRNLLLSLIDVPLAVSPVIAGMLLVLLYGSRGLLGSFLSEAGIKIIFAPPGIALATAFVTVPFIARELIPLMIEEGFEEEEVALTMGATGWRVFWSITLPNISSGLLYGLVLCNARAMGEFGAVSVVSGHIRGVTNTMPLHIEILYNEYQFSAAFAVSSILTLLALLTLWIKSRIDQNKIRKIALGGQLR